MVPVIVLDASNGSIELDSERNTKMNRIWYGILWVFEVIAIAVVALLLLIPIQDYARREFSEWYLHPSAGTLRAFREKQSEEFRVRLSIAAPCYRSITPSFSPVPSPFETEKVSLNGPSF